MNAAQRATMAWAREQHAALDAEEDLLWAAPGTRIVNPTVPVLDYIPATPQPSPRDEFFVGMAQAVLFTALGFALGVLAAILIALRML